MKMNAFWAAALLIAAFDSGAQGATLDQIQGTVFVSSGNGYVLVTAPTAVKGGDTILANPGGSAVLTCDDGNTIEVKPGKVTTVCDLEALAVPPEGGAGAAGLGAGGLGASGALIIGGIAVAGGAAAIVGISSNSDSPASGQ